MELTTQQNKVFEQIKAFLNSDASVFILRGYAGTGKTTMIKVIADYIGQNNNLALMAPTGRAARVLSTKTDYVASTIHKAIYEKAHVISKKVKDVAESEFKFVFPIRESEREGNIVAIVDEASMVCSRKIEHELFVYGTDNIMEDLLTYIRPNFGGKVIFVGDPAQLPPVGEPVSNALRAEYFKEKGLNVVEAELTEVLRQKGDSVILKNAMMIRDLLKKEKRNNLVFEEQKDDVETVPSGQLLDKYIKYRKESEKHDSVIICYSNKSANRYNRDIRKALYGEDVPLRTNDILFITQNNYRLNRMNGEFVPVLSVGARTQQSAPVYAQVGGKKQRIIITLNFVQVTVPDGDGNPMPCMLLEDLLTCDKATISIDENRALYINFCMRHPTLKQGTEEFAEALLADGYYNAIRAKYGYAVTGHKCQGGEWGKVFVDYTGRTGLDDDSLRWAYTATTRAQKTLYVSNLPHITPFSRFRIEPIQKCKNISPECRILDEVPATPFHNENVDNGLRAKYHCIAKNMEYTPYKIIDVQSRPYLEIYNIQTPDGVDRYDLYYKTGNIIIPFARKKATEFWVWQLLSEVFTNDDEKQIACLLRAVHCRTQETFLGKVHMKLATLYIKRGMLNSARFHIDAVMRCYASQGWRVPNEIECWIHQPWINSTTPDGNDPIEYKPITDAILCDGAEVCIAVVTYFDKNSHKAFIIYGKEKRAVQKLRFKVHAGKVLKLHYIKDKEGRMKILSSTAVQLPSGLDYAKYIDGTIDKRDDKEFAFLKSGSVRCFVSPNIVKEYDLKDGDNVKSLIVYDYDKKKEKWNWVCVNAKK